jgi:hypothetical protein
MTLYSGGMGNLASEQAVVPDIERILREELARGDKALSGVAPVLLHLLASPGYALVSDAVVARLRGMLADLARQILIAAEGRGHAAAPDLASVDRFADFLGADSAVLSHLYALAMEAQFTDRLDHHRAIDPVLSPLMQELIASERAAIADLAMSAMAAQSRFIQSQRRMELALGELPAELFHLVVRRSVVYVRESGQLASPEAVQTLRRSYDESATRIGLMGRLVAGMGQAACAALDLEHAGFALFATALGQMTRLPRELAVLACQDQQGARLALCLRAAGLDPDEVERQFHLLEPSQRLPAGIADIAPARAQAILGHSSARVTG